MWVDGQRHAAAGLPPGKTRYPLYRRLDRPQGRSGQVRKISHTTDIRSPDRQPLSESLLTSLSGSTFLHTYRRLIQKASGLTTVHEVDKAYGVLTLIFFNIVPFRSYILRPTFLPLLETFCELLFRDV